MKMSPDLRRIVHIRDHCLRIKRAVEHHDMTYESLLNETEYQDIISFNIFQIGELVYGLTEEYRVKNSDKIPWPKIRKMRNIIAHQYGDIDLDIIWRTASEDIPVLSTFCDEQLRPYDEEEDDG